MAILFCGIVMSHYTHFNLSPMTQITVQQIFRTTAFMAGIYMLFHFFSKPQKVTLFLTTAQGLTKVLSSCPGQVDFHSGHFGQLFILTCPMGKGSGKSSVNYIIKRANYGLPGASKI